MYEFFQYILCVLTLFVIITLYKFNLSNTVKFYIFGIISAESFTLFLFFAEKFSRLLSLTMFLFSTYFLLNTFSKFNTFLVEEKKQNIVIKKLTLNNLLIPFFPIIGFFLILLYLGMEFFVFDSHISTVTYIGIIHGLIIMIYNYVPLRYSEERDFGLLFFSFFVLTYLLPHAIYKISNSSAGTTDELGYMEYELVYFLLSKPLVLILNALNVPSYVAPSLGTVILFANLETGTMSTVGITSGCSGIYSIYIFTCAFLSFYLLKFKTFNFEGFLFLFSGIFIAYVCNLIRMTLVVLSGHYWGMDALEFTHANLGWIIFSFWFFVFWIFFDRYFFSKMEGLLNE